MCVCVYIISSPMHSQLMAIYYILFIFLFFFSAIHGRSHCSVSYCNISSRTIPIEFPFWLQNQQSQDCGLPGFNVSCGKQQSPVLDIPNSGRFIVSSILYDRRRIKLKDPDNCIFNRFLKLNLSTSPLRPYYYGSYKIFSCPKGKVSPYNSGIIGCLSNSTTDIVASGYLGETLDSMCRKITTLKVPDSDDIGFLHSLELTWSPTTAKENGNVHKDVKSIVLVALSVPLGLMLIAIFICMRLHNNSNAQQPDDSLQDSSAVALSSSNTRSVTNGLDDSVITTYKKITVGQSLRIEGPNDPACAICLEDYAVNDTIMFMPECEHCFHVECVDKWLKTSNKCPICRNSQAH